MTRKNPGIINIIAHKWFRVPYRLHVRHLHRSEEAKQTILFIHGLGATGRMWESTIRQLPKDYNVVSVDLLGFGKSPNPYWETYNAKLQARSLLRTYLGLRSRTPLIIVGHSLGSLVAIEFAKRYPIFTKSLILCSPPIYRDDTAPKVSRDALLKLTYEKLLHSPKLLMGMYNVGKASRIDPSLELDEDNMAMFAASMRSSIINQTAIDDIGKLKKPICIVHGVFDPVVVKSNLIKLQKSSAFIALRTVAASHPLNGAYIRAILAEITRQGE